MSLLVIGVLTLLLGGAVGAFIGHSLNAQRDRVEYRRVKLEALCLAGGQLRQRSEEWFNIWHCVVWESMPLERANALQDVKAQEVGDSFDKAESLIRMHFPDLQPELEKCETELSRFTSTLPVFRKKLEQQGKLSDYDHKAFVSTMIELQNSVDDLVRAIAKDAKKIGLINTTRERSPFNRS